MYSNKGMTRTTVMLLVLLIGFVVIFISFGTAFGAVKENAMHKMCTWSIVFKDKFIIGTNLCYTDDKEINGKEKEAVMKDIAEKMAECWKRMDEGRSNIDKNWFIGGYKCFKCDRIKITGLKDEITYEEFYKFLIKNNIKGKEESYYTFFKKYDEDNMITLLGKSNNIKDVFIDPKQYEYYAISFKGYTDVSIAPSTAIAYFTGPKGWVILGANMGIDLIREALSENSIIVAPYNEIDEVCSSNLR